MNVSINAPTATSIFGQISYSSSFMTSRVWPDFTDIFDGPENTTLLEAENDPSLHRQLMYELLKRKLWKYSHSSLWQTVDEDKCNQLLHTEGGFKTSFLQSVRTRLVRTMSILHFAITIMDEWAYQRRLEIKSQNNLSSSSSSTSHHKENEQKEDKANGQLCDVTISCIHSPVSNQKPLEPIDSQTKHDNHDVDWIVIEE